MRSEWSGFRGGKPSDLISTQGRNSHQTNSTSKMSSDYANTGDRSSTQSSRCVTCGKLGWEGIHFFVHHLLVQSPQAERLHGERQGPGQHGVHVHASEKRDIRV